MKGSKVRERVVKTAAELFYNNGYNLTGINEIIQEAGIAKATLYNHFKSKDDICIAYLQEKNNELMSSFKAYIAQANDGKGKIKAVFDFLSEFYQNPEFNGCWCINTVAEVPSSKIEIIKEIKRQKTQLRLLIQSIVTTALPDLEENELLSKKIYVLYEGAVVESGMLKEHWPIDVAKSIALELIEN